MNLNAGQAAEYMADVMETDAHNLPTQVPLKHVFLLP